MKLFDEFTKDLAKHYRKCGIYVITFSDGERQKFYIGKGKKMRSRLADHKRELLRNEHSNRYLQNYFNTYGKDSFSVEIAAFVSDIKNLPNMEQQILNLYLKNNFEVFNIQLDVLNLNAKFNTNEEAKEYSSMDKKGLDFRLSKKCPTLINIYTKHELNTGLNYKDTSKFFNLEASNIGKLIRGELFHIKGYVVKDKYPDGNYPTELPKHDDIRKTEAHKNKLSKMKRDWYKIPKNKEKGLELLKSTWLKSSKPTPVLIHLYRKDIIQNFSSLTQAREVLKCGMVHLRGFMLGQRNHISGYIEKEKYDSMSVTEIEELKANLNPKYFYKN
jgi:hypothetical protein